MNTRVDKLREGTMDKFKLAHTTRAPKIAKPIQKPKPKYFQKKIKELLTAAPVSFSDSRQNKKNKENAVKFLTNEAGGIEKDRSSVLQLLKQKKSKTPKKKEEASKPNTDHKNNISDEHVKIRRIEENIKSPLRKVAGVSSPKEEHCSLESAKQVQLDSFITNTSKKAKKDKKEILENNIKQLKSPKSDSSQVSNALDMSNKSSCKTSSHKTKENILSIKRKEKRITNVEQHLKGKKSKKVKSHKNKKQNNVTPATLETKDIQKGNSLDPNQNIKDIEDSSRQDIGEIGHLHKKKAPRFVCKRSSTWKIEHTKSNPLLKRKKKAKKINLSFKETKQKISSKEENDSVIQKDEWTSEPLSCEPSLYLTEKTDGEICKKNPKKKKKRKMQLKSVSDVDIDIEDPTELNNSTASREIVDISSHITENKKNTQKPITFKKKREALGSAFTISENLQGVSTPLEGTDHEISMLRQNVNLQLEEAVTTSGFDVEVIEIDSSECSSPKVDVKIHKKGKGNSTESSKKVPSARAAAEQESSKKPNQNKTKKLNVDIDIEEPTELNNSTASREIGNVSSHITENKKSTQKPITSKKKREALGSACTISENLEGVSTPLEGTDHEISTLRQNVNSQLEEAVTTSGFNVEVIEIDSSECSSPKVDVKIHKKGKGNSTESSKKVPSARAAAEEESSKKPNQNKTKKLKEKLDSKEASLEANEVCIIDTEEPAEQLHSSSREQLVSAPLVVNVANGIELSPVSDIFHNIRSLERREIHSVIQEFIPAVSDAQSTFLKTATKKNRKLQQQTVTHDTSPVMATERRSKPKKRKHTGEDKYPENISIQQKDSTKTKISLEPLIISATANTESFHIPSLLAGKPDEPLTRNKNVAEIHSAFPFLLDGKDKNETLENAQECASQEKNQFENSDTNAMELENPVEVDSKSPRKKLSENADTGMESGSESDDYIEVLQDLEDENSTAKLNVSAPLLVDMKDVESPTVPAIFNRLPAESVSATEEVHHCSVLEQFMPEHLRDKHKNHTVKVTYPASTITTNSRKKKEINKKQQKKLHKDVDDSEAEDDSIKFYSIPNSSRFLLFMKYPSLLYFKGKLTVSVLSGIIEVLGYEMSEESCKHVVYSPKGSSLMSLQTCESDENKVVNYASLTEKLTKIGVDISVTKDILTNLGQRDCLVILDKGPIITLEEFVKRLPPDMHFFDVSNENRKERNPRSCLYQAQKKLECIFELASSAKSFRRYTKGLQWEELVQLIIKGNVENLQKGPVSTVVCGGKGVGKSTVLRYLVNKCIVKFGKVLWLDFDPGQAEFVMPGCVAAVVIDEPLLGPNFTHLKKAERMVFVGDVNVAQCPKQYLESVHHIINYCRSNSELKRIPWLANTMGFCKGLGVDLTTTIIRLLKPHKLVQIHSESFKRNFPSLLTSDYVANYHSTWLNGPPPGSVTLNYDIYIMTTMTDSEVPEKTVAWGMEPRRLREAMILSYLSQMVEPPRYSIFDIVPYVTPFNKLTLCICHKPVSYAQMLGSMNGNLVALCHYDGNEVLVPSDPQLPKIVNHQPVCPCLGFGIVRGIDFEERKLFLITPVSQQDLQQVNCLMMGAIMLPAYLYTAVESGMGHIPYVSAGPGQPTSKVIRRFFRPLQKQAESLNELQDA